MRFVIDFFMTYLIFLFRKNLNNYYICFKRMTHARNKTDIL
jgi:hypothetical protein